VEEIFFHTQYGVRFSLLPASSINFVARNYACSKGVKIERPASSEAGRC
jgi:hypothetical protein